jgi:glycine/D-amino acid oxidase-like deaminating enzyme
LRLSNTIEMADFYERIHGREQAVAVGFSPDPQGALIVTEAVAKIDRIHQRSSSWGLAGMASELLQLYPGLGDVRAVRSWAVPTAFTPDDEPLVGWLPELDNLFVGASFLETITAVPVASEWMATMILGEETPVDLSPFSPGRFRDDRGAS